MIAWEAMQELWRGLREERARVAMTLTGLAWGSFAVIVLLAFGTGLHQLLQKRSASVGKAIAVVWPQRTTQSFEGLGRGRSRGDPGNETRNQEEAVAQCDVHADASIEAGAARFWPLAAVEL